ncbi:B-box zinc finger protein 20-like isoform X2 [Oryza glaberrima]|uniref:B-box zinc finger protein 20-like isoform X2 n=1 Tax=Oryza glaberrima TaxID=4538 RepID=UPI00224C5E23|nr:B-box zinc finger protein 20-like isoform X2 [Oryza glaberrima]
MRVQCDVCAAEPAAVLCCADEAALCSACDRRVHRANRLASKHRRLPLVHPSSTSSGDGGAAAAPLCDVCREKRGLVFCVEDRAILCADCDEPIHSANDLTAKHTRFLLVGAKLSPAALAEQPVPSSDCSSDDDAAAAATEEEYHSSAASTGAAVSAPLDASSNGAGGGGGVGGSSISDYLTTICPGWRVEDLLPDDDAFAAAAAAGKEKDERVPFLDADLFDVVAGRPEKKGGAWAPHVPHLPAWCLDEVPVVVAASAAPAATPVKAKQGHVRDSHWSDSDAFAVPEFSPPPPPAKRARPSSQYWCF